MIGVFWRTPIYVLLGATCILLVTSGVRQSFGLFIQPISIDMNWGRESISFAIATQNLLIGLAAPCAAMIADMLYPDLILLDLMMPVLDGFGVLRRLREDPIARRIPVIILTAKIDPASERACMGLGAVDYIKKPWGPQEIEERVAMALGYPVLHKLQQTGPGEPAAGEENGNSPGGPGGVDIIDPPYQQPFEQPEGPSPDRFKTKAFRIQGGEVDNPYLA